MATTSGANRTKVGLKWRGILAFYCPSESANRTKVGLKFAEDDVVLALSAHVLIEPRWD